MEVWKERDLFHKIGNKEHRKGPFSVGNQLKKGSKDLTRISERKRTKIKIFLWLERRVKKKENWSQNSKRTDLLNQNN